MSDWRALVDEALHPRDTRDNSANRDATGPFVPNVPIVPPLDPVRALRLCRKGLGSLDLAKPLHGLSGPRWRQLADDADWLLVQFGEGAFRNGWTVADLFGVWPDKDAWGGLADRLQGARSLKMTADRAHWRSVLGGVPDSFNRGAYPALRLLWEPGQCS